MKPVSDPRRSPDLPKRVLFLNDVGFQYGAGIAQARQLECIMDLGIEAGVLTWAHGNIPLETVATRRIVPELWLGIHQVNHLEGGGSFSTETLITGLLMEVARFRPEVIIVGNLHAARWPFALLPALRRTGCRVLTFLHDAYLYTGRCAYPGACQLYLSGCNEACPTADQYPALEPALIPAAWQVRRDIFGGPHGIEVIANSQWSKRMFLTALPACEHVETIELSANEDIFKPADKPAARRLLGLPGDKPIVLCAAVNFQEARKGGQALRAIIATLQNEVSFAAFGHNAQEIPGLIGLGYHLAADKIAAAYQAADVFLGTATEEAFGQTIMEAQLCGVPVVAFNAGGVSEIVRHEITGKLVRNGDAAAAVAAIRALLADPQFLSAAATQARTCAVSRFSMAAHSQRWFDFLTGKRRTTVRPSAPTVDYADDGMENTPDRHCPSWGESGGFLSPAHEAIFSRKSTGNGGMTSASLSKLYEMGYHIGDVILEVGTESSLVAITALRAAVANPARTASPLYLGMVSNPDLLPSLRADLAAEQISERCHLFAGPVSDFLQGWALRPTMIVMHRAGAPGAALENYRLLRGIVPVGTPVLVQADRDEREAWAQTANIGFFGCFGSHSLYLTR